MIPPVNYSRDVGRGYPGMIANTEPHLIVSGVAYTTVEGVANEANPVIGFGVPVALTRVEGVGDGMALNPALSVIEGDLVAQGITVADRSLPHEKGNTFHTYDSVGVMKRGTIWVKVAPGATSFKATDPVIAQFAADGSFTGFSNLAGSGVSLTFTDAEWVMGSSDLDAVAMIRLLSPKSTRAASA